MKKIYCFVFLAVAITFSVNAQLVLKKMSLTNFGLPHQRVHYPTHPLANDIITYTIMSDLPDDVSPNVVSFLKDNINLKSFKKVDLNPDLIIVIKSKHLRFDAPTKNVKEKSTSVSVVYSYNFQFVLTYASTNKKIEEYSGGMPAPGNFSIWSKEFSSEREADAAIRNIDKHKAEILIEGLERDCKKISTDWSLKYGYRFYEHPENLLRISDKDYYYTYFYLRNIQPLADVFKEANIYNPPANHFEKIKPYISYFEEVIPLFQKKQPSVTKTVEAASYLNIAKIYYLCEMIDKSQEYIEKGRTTGELKRDFDNLERQIKGLQKIYEQRDIQRLSDDTKAIERSRW